MIDNRLASEHFPKLSNEKRGIVSARYPQGITSPQEAICEFLISIVKTWSPEAVLIEFQELFIKQTRADEFALECLTEIVLKNQKPEFENLLRRCCYILANNWNISRNYDYISLLIGSFDDSSLQEKTEDLILGRLRSWVRSFVSSPDFEALKLVTTRSEDRGAWHWSQRYMPYLLASQYANLKNPLEQRQVAQKISRQLKEQFKFELAMYTARSQSGRVKLKGLKNPTSLGDEVLQLIKIVVVKRGTYSYPNLAKIFLQQTQDLSYATFKKSLLEYLFFGIEMNSLSVKTKRFLADQLESLYVNHHDKNINEALLLRTVKRLTESLTAERNGELSDLFIFLSLQQNPLMLVILLLKLTLICRYVKTHIEVCIANVVKHYKEYQEDDCVWVVQFLELFTIISTIYSENIEYNLVDMQNQTAPQSLAADLEAHRIFSLQKYVASRLQ